MKDEEAYIDSLKERNDVERKATQNMHRRAQKAEGAVLAAMDMLDVWARVYQNENRPGSPYANMVIRDVRKALNRSQAQPTPSKQQGED